MYQELSISQIRESAANPRKHFDPKKLDELTSSIRQKGVLVPVIVRPVNGHFELAAGHRRFRASQAAGLEVVPAIVREMDEETFLEVLTIENLQREDIHPLDEAEGFEQLLKLKGYSIELLAEKIGKSESYIHRRRALGRLIGPVRQAFLEDRITIAHAIKLAPLEPKDQKSLFEEMFREESVWNSGEQVGKVTITMSPSELDSYIRSEVYLDLARASFPKDDATLLPKAGSCTACSKRTGANLALFDDTKKGDHCLDRACFQQKQNAQVVHVEKAAKAQGTALVRLTRSYSGPKGTVGVHSVHVIKAGKGTCENAERGLMIDGPEIGSVVNICRASNCPKHKNVGSSVGSRPEKTFAQIWAEKKVRLDDEIRLKVQREVWREIIAAVPETFEQEDVVVIGKRLIERAGHDNQRVLCAALCLNPETTTRHGSKFTDFEGALVAELEKLEGPQQAGFLVGLCLLSYNGFDEEDLRFHAERLEIDWAATEKTVADPLRAEFEQKKARAAAARKKAAANDQDG